MDWEERAYELLSLRPDDVVRLALSISVGASVDFDGLDLRALASLEIKAGSVRVDMVSKAALLEVAVKAGWVNKPDEEAAKSFFAALEQAAETD